MELILSIIVPVYNVEKYLNKCVSTLLSQDLEKNRYEIILVDDGSTDSSGTLCDKFASSEPNVTAIHQVNQGLSVARNTGIAAAAGRYILFVDSDDWIEDNVLGELIRRMEDAELDLLCFGFRRVFEREGTITIDSEERRSDTEFIWTGKDYLMSRLGFLCYAWQFLIKRSVLEENHLLFRPGIIFEDTEWTPRVFEIVQRVSESGLLVYDYRQREGSITKGSEQKVVDGQILLIDFLKAQMSDWENKDWHKGMIAHIVLSVVTLVSTKRFSQRNSILKELNSKKVFPLSSFNASKSAMRKIKAINLSPRIASLIIYLVNR